jgi:inosose dehydratase
MNFNRRSFLNTLAGVTTLSVLSLSEKTVKRPKFPISCNSYNWITFYGREKKSWGEDLESCIAEFSKTGITAYEPGLSGLEEVKKLIPVLKKYNISMPSVYVGSVMHTTEDAQKSITEILAIADEVKTYGTKIIVTNPNPIKWGSEDLKTDEQLTIQAAAMENLGAALRQKGLTLAYHTHAPEFKAGAREFHHTLLNTTPQNVSFCFDVHWVFRGSNDSNVAVFDVLKLYGKRVVELHVRQSVNGVWSETFGEGDIDYVRFAEKLKAKKISPLIVIEQCVEDKSPHTMNGLAAHIKDLAAFKKIFAAFLD